MFTQLSGFDFRCPRGFSARSAVRATLLLALLLGITAGPSGGCRRTSGENDVSPLASDRPGADDQFDGGDTPIRDETYLAAGRLAESRGDLELAAQQYRRVLRRRPEDREALFRLGVVLSRQRDPAAVEVWQRYLAVTDSAATGWANLGLSYEMLGEPQRAEEAYRQGIARDPGDRSCRVNYGMFLATRGDHEAAVEQFAQVLTPAQGWYNVGSVCERQGKREQAIAAYRRALATSPDLAVARQRLNTLTAPAE